MNAIKKLSYIEVEKWKYKYPFHPDHTRQYLYYYNGFRAYFEQPIHEFPILTKDIPSKIGQSLNALDKIYFRNNRDLRKKDFLKQDVLSYIKCGHILQRPKIIRKGLRIGKQDIKNYIRYCLFASIKPIITQ